jgi:hypothetical protein
MQQLDEVEKQEALPFSSWWPVAAGALLGVMLRLVFSGHANGPYGAMMGSFIFLAPAAVSAVTVYLAERRARRGWGYYAFAGMFSNVLFVVGTLMILIEGWICAIVILPLFALFGVVTGLLMGAVCRLTRWPKQAAYSVVVLPLLLGAVEPTAGLPVREKTIDRTLLIDAPRNVVWDQLMNVRDIRHDEVGSAIAFRIGVPPPMSAISGSQDGAVVRRISMGKRVYFDQVAVEQREQEYVRWAQRFYPDSFPPGSFDEHVVMGGPYFDIGEVEYTLTPEGGGTRLSVSMHYRVSTRFNWYADAVARLMLGNVEEVLLGLYQSRAQATAATGQPSPAR